MWWYISTLNLCTWKGSTASTCPSWQLTDAGSKWTSKSIDSYWGAPGNDLTLLAKLIENPVPVREECAGVKERGKEPMFVRVTWCEAMRPDTTHPKSKRYSGRGGLRWNREVNIDPIIITYTSLTSVWLIWCY